MAQSVEWDTSVQFLRGAPVFAGKHRCVIIDGETTRQAQITAFADDLQSMMPQPAPVWAVRLLFRWRLEASR
jgi:hypothetical protein